MSNQACIAVVTTAGGGIGRAIVEQLCADGFTVVAVDRDERSLHLLPINGSENGQLHLVVGDMTNVDDVTLVYHQALGVGWGPLQKLLQH